MKKYLLALLLLLPVISFAGHHKHDSITFYLDMTVAEGKSDGLQDFVSYLEETVKKTEPNTMYYKYYISDDGKKVSLIEHYANSKDALFHVNAFLVAPHREQFLETFVITNFQVMGNSSDELKKAMADFTKDHRKFIGGFKRK